MRLFLPLMATLFLTAPLVPAQPVPPVPIIFDTDMGNDVDDALALAMIHTLESRGEAKLLAVTVTKDNLKAAQFVDILNRFYGRPSIPVGLVRNGVTPEDNPMIAAPIAMRDAAGRPVFETRIASRDDAEDPVTVLRRTLEQAADASVVIVQVGFSTNLARLLDSPGGRELAARKVRLLSAMAGAFPAGKPEYNIKMDIASARKVFVEWPTPIVVSGFEIGLAIEYPGVSIERDYRYVPRHPVAESYRAYQKMPYDRPTWDLTSVLYAVRPQAGDFTLSGPGTIRIAKDGTTSLEAAPDGRHRYLILDPTKKQRIIRTMVDLASAPPTALLRAQTAKLREMAAAAPRLPLQLSDVKIQMPKPDWELGYVSSAAAAPDGTVYLLQRGLTPDPVLVIDRQGRVIRSWGRGLFQIPHSIRLDAAGDVWTVDAASSKVFKFSRDGKLLLEIAVGGQPQTTGAFNGTADIAFSKTGRVFVADGYGNARVLEYTPQGRKVREWGVSGTGPSEFHLPHGIAIDEDDTLFVADRENGRIQRFTLDGKYLGEFAGLGKTFSVTAAGGALWIGTQPREEPNGAPGWIMKLDRKTGRILGVVESSGHHSVSVTAEGEIFTGVRPDRLLWFRDAGR